jgi:hypothetical protein
VRNNFYFSTVGGKKNEHCDKMYKFLDELGQRVSNAEFVLRDVDQEEKEGIHCDCSEILAVGFGILNLIWVIKKLRIFGDCHNAIKFMTKIVGVHIIVKDPSRLHHFRDGNCSCHKFFVIFLIHLIG